MIRIRFVARY